MNIKEFPKPLKDFIKIMGWIFGILFMLLGLFSFFDTFLAGFFTLLSGIVLFPPVWRFIKKKKVRLKPWMVLVFFVVFFTLGMSFSSPTDNVSNKTLESSEQNSLNEKAGECIPDWSCDTWSECLVGDFKQRTCLDLNDCKSSMTETKECDYSEKYIKTIIDSGISQNRIYLFKVDSSKEILGEKYTKKYEGMDYINLVFFYQDEKFVDEYLTMLFDSSRIYKSLFNSHPEVLGVSLIVLKNEENVYGNTETKILGDSYMVKETSNKINWQNFDSYHLDEVTSVEYYGDSIYKGLKDLNEELERWDEYYKNY